MLSGARSSELGIDTTSSTLSPAETARFYASDPPLLPLVLRRHGMITRAFVNDPYMAGYGPAGVDMGFERVDDHRHRTRGTREVTEAAAQWLEANKDSRFFAFVSYSAPREPHQDDEAIRTLMRTLDETGLSERTIVVLTAASLGSACVGAKAKPGDSTAVAPDSAASTQSAPPPAPPTTDSTVKSAQTPPPPSG